MLIGFVTALAAAVAYGVASVLQAVASRSTEQVEGLDPRLLIKLVRSWRYVLGVALDGVGFVLALVAVRALPLFVVQSVVASFLAITAVLGAVFLKMPLTRLDRVALGVVVAGLALVGSSAAEDAPVTVGDAEQWGLLIVTIALAILAIPLAHVAGTAGAAVLGSVAGLAFGATAVASRMLPGDVSLEEPAHSAGVLLRSPALYALAIAGFLAMLTYSTALQRASVTQATAPLVVGETVAPALVGLFLLGDEPRPGWGWVAAVGFALSVGGALALAGHGEMRVTDE